MTKKIIIQKPITASSRYEFVDLESKERVSCAFLAEKSCSPNCAACEITETSFVATATCLRGAFPIGEIKKE